MSDARFEGRADKPLRLIAFDASDLQVISTMVQDAIFPVAEMSWRSHERRFLLLLNRFRWEVPQSDIAERVPRWVNLQQVVNRLQRVLLAVMWTPTTSLVL